MQILASRRRSEENQPPCLRAARLLQELGLPHWRGNVQEMVRRDWRSHDWRSRQDAIYDGRTANPHFRGRQVGQLIAGWRLLISGPAKIAVILNRAKNL